MRYNLLIYQDTEAWNELSQRTRTSSCMEICALMNSGGEED